MIVGINTNIAVASVVLYHEGIITMSLPLRTFRFDCPDCNIVNGLRIVVCQDHLNYGSPWRTMTIPDRPALGYPGGGQVVSPLPILHETIMNTEAARGQVYRLHMERKSGKITQLNSAGSKLHTCTPQMR